MIDTATLLLTRHVGPGVTRARERADSIFTATRVAGGYSDPQRFAALVTRYQARVHRLVASILGPAYSGDAEDATQEVFLHAYRKLDTFRGDSKISTWLYRLATNRAIDYRRRLGRRREDAPLPDEPVSTEPRRAAPAPLGALLAGERGARLRAAVEGLPRNQRTAVYLHYWLGSTIAEISELTDTKPATVKSHLFRARRALAGALEGEGR